MASYDRSFCRRAAASCSTSSVLGKQNRIVVLPGSNRGILDLPAGPHGAPECTSASIGVNDWPQFRKLPAGGANLAQHLDFVMNRLAWAGPGAPHDPAETAR